MRMYDLLMQKKHQQALSEEQINFFIAGYTKGDIPDYQASALLMAISMAGMNQDETAFLTDAMARSGDMVDLSPIPGIKVDKHSTGGVGDKTTLIIGPMVAACGVPVAKMSGRGLGHTGGTVDKLESIPGLQTEIPTKRFFDIVRKTGLAVIGQSGNIAPADKKLYALRDVTATVDSIPLIASSIMSKKLASGADAILLDVKTGSGAFMKTLDDSIALAEAMVSIGAKTGRNTQALVTNMNQPLGNAIGNAIEIIEAIDTLKGNGPEDITEICIELAAGMLVLADKGSLDECRAMAKDTIDSGKALEHFKAMVHEQGGDETAVDDTSKLPQASVITAYSATSDGVITAIETELCGVASAELGAGRLVKDAPIDHGAGIVLKKKPGDSVSAGETIAMLHTNDAAKVKSAKEILDRAYTIGVAPAAEKLIQARITPNGVEKY